MLRTPTQHNTHTIVPTGTVQRNTKGFSKHSVDGSSDSEEDDEDIAETISIFENGDDFDQLFDNDGNPTSGSSQVADADADPFGVDKIAAATNLGEIVQTMIRESQNYDPHLNVICASATTMGKRSYNEDVCDVRLNELVDALKHDHEASAEEKSDNGDARFKYSYFAVYDGSLCCLQCPCLGRKHRITTTHDLSV